MKQLESCSTCGFQDQNRGFCHCPDRCAEGENTCFSEVSSQSEALGSDRVEVCEFFSSTTQPPKGGMWKHDETGDYFVTVEGEIFNPLGFDISGVEYYQSSTRLMSREEIERLVSL